MGYWKGNLPQVCSLSFWFCEELVRCVTASVEVCPVSSLVLGAHALPGDSIWSYLETLGRTLRVCAGWSCLSEPGKAPSDRAQGGLGAESLTSCGFKCPRFVGHPQNNCSTLASYRRYCASCPTVQPSCILMRSSRRFSKTRMGSCLCSGAWLPVLARAWQLPWCVPCAWHGACTWAVLLGPAVWAHIHFCQAAPHRACHWE